MKDIKVKLKNRTCFWGRCTWVVVRATMLPNPDTVSEPWPMPPRRVMSVFGPRRCDWGVYPRCIDALPAAKEAPREATAFKLLPLEYGAPRPLDTIEGMFHFPVPSSISFLAFPTAKAKRKHFPFRLSKINKYTFPIQYLKRCPRILIIAVCIYRP